MVSEKLFRNTLNYYYCYDNYLKSQAKHSLLKRVSQPPPQALRFSHGRGERETSDW